MPFRTGKRFEGYTIQYVLGRGNEGGAVYSAVHEEDVLREPVALKHPVRCEEQLALRALSERAPDCPGVPPLLDWGAHFVAVELLGPPIKTIFQELEARPLDSRWEVVRICGRVLLRSLQAIHHCGLVHCDVQPSNILLGRTREGLARPFLVDFGCARAYPDGEPMQGDWGSIDFNSTRSADGGVRRPYDDLESLGWVLCHGLFGDLPWFEWTRNAWESGEWKKRRESLSKRVQRAKATACEKGWGRLGPGWKHLGQIPKQLLEYLRICQRGEGQPDYDALVALLGLCPKAHADATVGSGLGVGADPVLKEEVDLQSFDALVPSLLPGERLEASGMRVKDRDWHLEGFGAPWQRLAASKLADAVQAEARTVEAGAATSAVLEEVPEDASSSTLPTTDSSPRTPRSSFVTFDFSELEGVAACDTGAMEPTAMPVAPAGGA